MLPYGLKVVWVVLCTTGAATSWPVLWALAKTVDNWWAPMTYAVALTAMVLVFDIGLIWELDPSRMSRAACLTQMGLVTFFALLLVGVCTSFNIAVTFSTFWPIKAHEPPHVALRWRNIYLIFLLGFPCVSTVAEILVVIKYDAFEQSKSATFCDVSSPLWPRLLGYAGMPALQLIPCVFLASRAALRLRQIHKIHQRLLDQVADNDDYYHDYFRKSSICVDRPSHSSRQPSTSSYGDNSHGLPSVSQPDSPPTFVPDMSARKTPTDSAASQPPLSSPHSRRFHANTRESLDYPVFASFSTLASQTTTTPSPLPHVVDMEEGMCEGHEDGASLVESHEDRDTLSSSKVQRPSTFQCDPNSPNGNAGTTGETNTPTLSDQDYGFGAAPLRSTHGSTPSKPLLWQIWRLLLFQGAFFFVVAMLTLSTLISVITDSRPVPFGTEHVSGILSSWGPVLVFGHSPLIRRKLMFWRQPQPS